MAIRSSILAWETPGIGEPGGLQSLGLQRVRHDVATKQQQQQQQQQQEFRWFYVLENVVKHISSSG